MGNIKYSTGYEPWSPRWKSSAWLSWPLVKSVLVYTSLLQRPTIGQSHHWIDFLKPENRAQRRKFIMGGLFIVYQSLKVRQLRFLSFSSQSLCFYIMKANKCTYSGYAQAKSVFSYLCVFVSGRHVWMCHNVKLVSLWIPVWCRQNRFIYSLT